MNESTNYYQLLTEKVDHQFEKVYVKHASSFACKVGCHSCCQPDLTVSLVESEAIKSFLQNNPDRMKVVKELASENPHENTRCSMLSRDGTCSIYEIRPLICRSHGAPVLVQLSETQEALDTCPLNFQEGLDVLDSGDWINLETLNTLLALINHRVADSLNESIRESSDALCEQDIFDASQRIPLTISHLLES